MKGRRHDEQFALLLTMVRAIGPADDAIISAVIAQAEIGIVNCVVYNFDRNTTARAMISAKQTRCVKQMGNNMLAWY